MRRIVRMGYEIHIDCAGQVRLPVARHLCVENESVQSCGLVMLTEPVGFGQRQAGSLCANDGMRLPKSH